MPLSVDELYKWNDGMERWLLLAGATDPPEDVDISDRRSRDDQGERNGAFLHGVTRDLVNMEDTIGGKLYNTLKNLYMTRSEAVGHIKRFFDHCQRNGFKPMLYYTGHGQVGTGNWCFEDGTIGIQEIVDILPTDCYYPHILSDACYSGNWANFCTGKDICGFHCLAACPEFSTALDIKGIVPANIVFMSDIKCAYSFQFYTGRVTIQLVTNLPMTSKQKFRFGLA